MSSKAEWKPACLDVLFPEPQTGDGEPTPWSRSARVVPTRNSRMWPNGKTLTFCFLDACPGTPAQRAKVRTVIKEWEKYANIKFDYVDAQDATIRIIFDEDHGSWSYVGCDIEKHQPPKPTMNLSGLDDTDDIGDIDSGVILHEFGHTLGLGHEHQSPMHGGRLKLKAAETIDYYTNLRHERWTESEVRQQILRVYNQKEVSNYSKLDLKSVMMYTMPAEMNERGVVVTSNNELSELDKAYITLTYPRDDASVDGTEWTVGYALEVAGVDREQREVMLEDYRIDGWSKLRSRLFEWKDGIRNALAHRPLHRHTRSLSHSGKNRPTLQDESIISRDGGDGAGARDIQALSSGAQAIKEGFKRLQNPSGVIDPRMSYGRIPS